MESIGKSPVAEYVPKFFVLESGAVLVHAGGFFVKFIAYPAAAYWKGLGESNFCSTMAHKKFIFASSLPKVYIEYI